jgi:4-amino-4-deoxy-L-arabinose transferase-like glycosyltransferase
MLHDYVANLKWTSPLAFALEYYRHYPKVAFGHWPPFFYVVQAIWMLLFSTSRMSVRLEIAFTTALLAYSVCVECRRWFGGRKSAVLAGLLTVCIPLVQKYADEEMSEVLLTLMCFWAAVFFSRYLDSQRVRDNVLFALFFALAILTKGTGWLLAGIIPIGVVLTRKFLIVKSRRFWVAPAIVGILCLPWQLFTLTMAEQGWADTSHAGVLYAIRATGEFSLIVLRVAGLPLAFLAILGIVAMVLAPAVRGSVKSSPAVMLSLIICTIIFHAVVPAGVEDRKMLIAIPAWVLFIFAGGFWLSGRLALSYAFTRWAPYLLTSAAIAAFLLGTFSIPQQKHYGFEDAARYIGSRPDLAGNTILVSDNSIGEGLLISEIAMHEKRPGETIVRGTKALADVDWGGSRYRSLYATPQQLIQALDKLHIDLVVTDTFPGTRDWKHNQLLRQALQDRSRFQLIGSFDGDSQFGRGKVMVYQMKNSV